MPFVCASPKINESAQLNEDPENLALRLATEKALALAPKFNHHLIIGSDQVAHCEEESLGKPGNFEAAKQQLKFQSGKTVIFYTAVSILNSVNGDYLRASVQTSVQFKTLTDNAINHYLEKETPFNCAGSFKSEGLGICLFEEIRSNDPTALIGLPLIKTTILLEQHGFEVLNR